MIQLYFVSQILRFIFSQAKYYNSINRYCTHVAWRRPGVDWPRRLVRAGEVCQMDLVLKKSVIILKKKKLVVNLFNKANDLGPKTLCLHHNKCILRHFYLKGKFYKVEEYQQYSSELSDHPVAQK